MEKQGKRKEFIKKRKQGTIPSKKESDQSKKRTLKLAITHRIR